MPGTDYDLHRLLAPVDAETFFQDYWEKQALVLPRRDPLYYAGLLSSADVDHIIAFTRPKFPDPSAFSSERPKQKTYVQGWLADRPSEPGIHFPGISELQQVYAQGKTISIMTMQQRWLPIAVLCRHLEAVFHCPVHANMYLTPPGAQGFDAHFDTHEVLVLQLEGHKHWKLYGPGRALPLVDEGFPVARDTLGPPREVILEPGDLLYLPRGHVHEAFTSECASLHLTVGINVFRWVDLMQEALTLLAREDRRFRESLPPGSLAGEVPAALGERFRELLDALANRARAEESLGQLGDGFFGQLQPLPGGRFAPPTDVPELSSDTLLEKVPGMMCRVTQEGGWVVIAFPGGHLGGPSKIAPALRFVAAQPRFTVADLPELGGAAQLVLARRLLREGLLVVAGPGVATHQSPRGTGTE
jgi:ribosomal protein L16 Arg81 hydroxylase